MTAREDFDSYEATPDAHLADYKSVSRLAVVALVSVLLAPIAYAGLTGLVFPLASCVLALWAVGHIRRHARQLSGTGIAYLALALATFIAVSAPARLVSRQRVMYQKAESCIASWFEYLQAGNVAAAHHLTLPQHRRMSTEADMQTYYRDFHQQELAQFQAREPIQSILRTRAQGKLRPEARRGITINRPIEEVTLEYVYEYQEAAQTRRLPVTFKVNRIQDPNSLDFRWHIQEIEAGTVNP